MVDDEDASGIVGDGPGRAVLDASAGPRVVSLLGADGEELLAELDPPVVVGPDDASARLRGGHRLWAAPEVPAVTYTMDDGPGELDDDDDGVVARDAGRPLSRSLRITGRDGTVELAHAITNHGTATTVAPWALTQLRPGGTVVLPLGTTATDPHGLQAAGSLVTWPYTDLSDPRITVDSRAVMIRTTPGEEPETKVGVDGTVPWAAYVHGPTVLVVHRTPRPPDATWVDLGAATQAFVGPRFVEVEVLGPLASLGRGEACTLETGWSVHERPWSGDAVDLDALAELASAAQRTG